MAQTPTITNNTSRARTAGAVTAGAIAGGAAAAGIIAAAGGIAALRENAIQKRSQYSTRETIDGTLFDQRQQYYTSISIGEYKRSVPNITQLLNAFLKVATIFTNVGYKLPIPIKLIDKNSVNWSAEPLGKAEQAANAIMDKTPILKQANQISNLAGAAQALSGLAPNEFLTMLFKGPTYKEFSLQFLISPRTPQQSLLFRQMVANFKNAMAPSLTAGNLLFTYPNVFQIKFNKTTGSGPFLYEFKPAVLKTFTVDYAPANVPSFYVGTDEPESFVLSMDFQEIEFWLAGDFK
jgi:hypothetical protein